MAFLDAHLFVMVFAIFLLLLFIILIAINKSFEKSLKKLALWSCVWTALSLFISVFLFKFITIFENFEKPDFYVIIIFYTGLYLLFTFYAVTDCFNFFKEYFKNLRHKEIKTEGDRLEKATSSLALGTIVFILSLSVFSFLFVLAYALFRMFFDGTDFITIGFDFESYLSFITSIAPFLYVIFTGITLYYLYQQLKTQETDLSKVTDQLNNQIYDLKIKNINDNISSMKEEISLFYYPLRQGFKEHKSIILELIVLQNNIFNGTFEASQDEFNENYLQNKLTECTNQRDELDNRAKDISEKIQQTIFEYSYLDKGNKINASIGEINKELIFLKTSWEVVQNSFEPTQSSIERLNEQMGLDLKNFDDTYSTMISNIEMKIFLINDEIAKLIKQKNEIMENIEKQTFEAEFKDYDM